MSIFPVRESCTVTDFGSDATSHAANMPATANAGNLLLALVAFDGSSTTITTPSGWTLITANASLDPVVGVYAKVAAGTEGGGTVDWVTSNSQRGSVHVYRMSSWYGSLDGVLVSMGAAGTSSSAISLRTGERSLDIHWIVAEMKSSGTAFGTVPSGYTNEAKTNISEDTSSSASIASATRTNSSNKEEVSALWNTVSSFLTVLIAVLPVGGKKLPRASSVIGV
jgi:hypothetical protein